MKASPRKSVLGRLPGRWGWAIVLVVCAAAEAASLVPAGRPAPELSAATLDGEPVRLADLKGRTVLLLFGELYNPHSISACKDLSGVLAKPSVSGLKVSAFMIVTQQVPAAELRADAAAKGVALPILHDDGRRTFAAYQVMVLPSLVIIDGNGQTALACAGYPLDFADLVADSILLAAGSISNGEYDRRRQPSTMPAVSEAHVRASRLAALGEQLVLRGSEETAISTFRDAIALDPDCIPARVGLGNCLLNRRELAEGETQFRHVLKLHPDSVEGALGLTRVELIRGGGEIKSATERLRGLLLKRPNDAKVIYLSGLAAEKSGDASAAMGHYKRAAEILLYGQPQRWEVK